MNSQIYFGKSQKKILKIIKTSLAQPVEEMSAYK